MGIGGPKILIVDDDAEVARAFARILIRRGYNATIVSDGRSALARVEEEGFDVVISDVSMPGMSGVELVEEVYRRDPDLPVILISGGAAPVARTLDLLGYDACQCLSKPIVGDDLARAVLRAASLHRLALLRRESPDIFGDRPNPSAPIAGRSPVEWQDTLVREEHPSNPVPTRSGSSEM